VTDGAKTALKDEKTASRTYTTGLKTSTAAIVGDAPSVPYPTYTSASGFDYKTVTDNLEVITATVTRVIDSATATCTLSPAYVTAATSCDYTAFDELMFDYICGLSSTFTYKGSVIDCSSDTVRPSVSCYGGKKSELETTVATAIAAAATETCLAADANGNVVCTDASTGNITTTAADGSSVTTDSTG